MKKTMRLLTAILCLCLLLAACGQGSTPSGSGGATGQAAGGSDAGGSAGAEEPIVLKFAFAPAATSPDSVALAAMCERITERTGGGLVMEFYPNNELGAIADVTEMIQRGANIITSCSADFLADYSPDHAALNGAYLYDSWEDMQIIAKSDWYAGLMEQLDEHNIHVIFFGWNGGHRQMISTVPINTPDDLIGKNARVSGGLMFVEMYKAFGSSPITLPFNETYQGLQQGVIDIVEAPLFTMQASSLHEVGPYVTMTSHITCADVLFMNTELFNSLPEEYQQILLEEANETILAYNATVDDLEAKAEQDFRDAGVTIIELSDAQREEFAEACKSMYDNIPSLSPGIYDTIRSIIDAG